MRIIAEASRADFKISVFLWNSKYLVKFEQGPLEQTYKFSELDVGGDAAIKSLISDDSSFARAVAERFAEMRQVYGAALTSV